MTLPRASNEVLICFASVSACPVTPDRSTSSEPARSQTVKTARVWARRCALATKRRLTACVELRRHALRSRGIPSLLALSSWADFALLGIGGTGSTGCSTDWLFWRLCFSTSMRQTACEREECWFIRVDAKLRLFEPWMSRSKHSFAVGTGIMFAPSTYMPYSLSSRICNEARSCCTDLDESPIRS